MPRDCRTIDPHTQSFVTGYALAVTSFLAQLVFLFLFLLQGSILDFLYNSSSLIYCTSLNLATVPWCALSLLLVNNIYIHGGTRHGNCVYFTFRWIDWVSKKSWTSGSRHWKVYVGWLLQTSQDRCVSGLSQWFISLLSFCFSKVITVLYNFTSLPTCQRQVEHEN